DPVPIVGYPMRVVGDRDCSLGRQQTQSKPRVDESIVTSPVVPPPQSSVAVTSGACPPDTPEMHHRGFTVRSFDASVAVSGPVDGAPSDVGSAAWSFDRGSHVRSCVGPPDV